MAEMPRLPLAPASLADRVLVAFLVEEEVEEEVEMAEGGGVIDLFNRTRY